MPCGFTDDGLPVGLQIVGRHRDEWSALQMAHAFEQATQASRRRPYSALTGSFGYLTEAMVSVSPFNLPMTVTFIPALATILS